MAPLFDLYCSSFLILMSLSDIYPNLFSPIPPGGQGFSQSEPLFFFSSFFSFLSAYRVRSIYLLCFLISFHTRLARRVIFFSFFLLLLHGLHT